MLVYNIGYARAGRLDTFCNWSALPAGIERKDLRLDHMVPSEADDRDQRTILFRPLDGRECARWFLLVGIHNTHQDRNAYVVAGRVMDREAAEVLMRDPARLLTVGAGLLEETPQQVKDYQNQQAASPDWGWTAPQAAPVTAPLPPLTQGGRLLLCGAVKALLNGKRELGFVHADQADLQAVLKRLPLALALQLSFCLPFNLAGGCCTQLNLVEDGQPLDTKPRNGWPSEPQYIMTEAELAKQNDAPRFCLLYRGLEQLDGRQWDREMGERTAEETIRLLCAVGALLEQEDNVVAAEKRLMQLPKLRRSKARQLVAEAAQWRKVSQPAQTTSVSKRPRQSSAEKTIVPVPVLLRLLPGALLCLAGGAALLHIALPARFLITMTLELRTDPATLAGLAALLAGVFLLGRQSNRPHR